MLLLHGAILVLLLAAAEAPDFVQLEILAGEVHQLLALEGFSELAELGNQFEDRCLAGTQ